MKKGILQRVSKNWEETKMAPPLEVKQEPIADYPEPQNLIASALESNKASQVVVQRQTEVKKGQRDSMIAVRKDYSYKYNVKQRTSSTATQDKRDYLETSSPSIASSSSSAAVQSNNVEASTKPSPEVFKAKDAVKRPKPQISILERHNYDKAGPSQPKLIRMDNKASNRVILHTKPAYPSDKSHVPMEQPKEKVKATEREHLKVIVAQKVKSPTVKSEPDVVKTPTTPSEQNINKINNKINIIFQLNDNTKSLRKNIILHRRAPKKMVQKITIKEANNNTSDDATIVPEKVLCSVDTQTETYKQGHMNLSSSNPLLDEPTEHLFFEDDVLVSLQRSTISFFEFNRLGAMLKKGEADFKLIDRIPRRTHDTLVESDSKFQCFCYNDENPLPIYVEMRARQKELDDPDMCPIAFLYCNVYYIDHRRSAKFSSVHLDTVKSFISDVIYTTVPGSSYFIMAWNDKSVDMKSLTTGIVKYKLTPNLDLAKLASIREFPSVPYRTKQMNCGKDLQLLTFGDSQVSIFNYESGDLLMSLDLMKSYGINLTTFSYSENYLFMIYLMTDDDPSSKRVVVIGVNKFDGNTFKVIQTSSVKLRKRDKIVSKAITSTNHLLVTFSNGSVLLLHLNNFRDIHVHGSPLNESIFASENHLLVARHRNVGLRNFTEFFLN